MTRLPLCGLLALFLMAGCSAHSQDEATRQDSAETSTQTSTQARNTPSMEGRPVLLFFLNPHGRPCQMQQDILRNSTEISDMAVLKLVQTTVSTDRDLFYQYGIRALPTLLVSDSTGAELHRFSPGIHQSDEIIRVLDHLR